MDSESTVERKVGWNGGDGVELLNHASTAFGKRRALTESCALRSCICYCEEKNTEKSI